MNLIRLVLALTTALAVTVQVRAADADKLFQDSVRPLFERHCFQCHSSKADELKGNLKLETVESILKGGDNGPAVAPGNTEESFLLRAIRYQLDDYQMPPSGRLPDDDIALVERWVKAMPEMARKPLGFRFPAEIAAAPAAAPK